MKSCFILLKPPCLYLMIGIGFGFLFPISATILDIYIHSLSISWESVLFVQKQQPLHWMIDTAPIFLGLFALVGGLKQSQIVRFREAEKAQTKNLSNKFDRIFYDAKFGILIFNWKTKLFENINPAFLEMLGYTKEELAQEGINKISHPEDLVEERKIFSKLLRNKVSSLEFTKRYIHKNGKTVWCKLTYSTISDSEENVSYIITLIDNITEEKLNQQELLEQQRFIRRIIDTSPNLIFVKANDGKFLLVNESFAKVVGKKVSEIESFTSYKYSFSENDQKVFDQKENILIEERIVDSMGDEKTYLVNKAPIEKEGKIFLLGVATDISEQKKVQKLMSDAKELADNANRAKSLFLANMSHEIRTPMNGILGMIGVLAHSDISSEHKEIIEIIQSSGNSLLNIVNDILDYSKIESGKMELDLHVFDFVNLLKDVIELLKNSAHKKQLDIKLNLDDSIPKLLKGDSLRLRQILVNLIDNAVKFTKKGFVELGIKKIKTENGLLFLEFCVSDSGIGIEKDKVDLLFKSFSQVDISTSRKYGGTGLGLAICAKLVEMMNGRIWVESQIGKGSKFYFIISLESNSDLSLSPPNSIQHKNIFNKNIKILLAEDNPINQKVAVQIFKKAGFAIDIANNGLEVLSRLEKNKYDFIFMDVQMPELDGIATTKRIIESKITPLPTIIAITANAMSGDREICLEAGMQDYLSKPYKQEEIENIIKKWEKD